MTIISPSILSADFMNLEREMAMLDKSVAEWVHIDVMDGHFVPNLTIGMPIVAQLRKITQKILDVHLMITQPERYIDRFIASGADVLTIHYEATEQPQSVLEQIRKKGIKAGISIKPNTPVSVLEPLLPFADIVLIMTVEPGFGGQKFMYSGLDKIKALRTITDQEKYDTQIEVDGGVNAETGQLLVDAGTDILVAGSYVFGADNPIEPIRVLHELG